MSEINVGLIGYGYWGPYLARNFNANTRCRLAAISDLDHTRLVIAQGHYPGCRTTSDPTDILKDTAIDVVALATPVRTHYELALAALENGKHVWVEKPLTRTSEEAEELVAKADAGNRILLVDHTFLFTSAVQKIHEIMKQDILGEILYYDSVRINLGLIQPDVNVIWDLAPHDISLLDHLLDSAPLAISAHGVSHYSRMEEMAYVTMYCENNVLAHLHVNWLSPVKIRHTVIGGRKKMLVWNDLEQEEKIRIYDKGVDVMPREDGYAALGQYRIGDMFSPALNNQEALATEIDHFLDCIETGSTPINDGQAGCRVVKILEAADRSLANRGKIISLDN